MLSAAGFIQTLNAWKAPTGVLTAIQEFNKVDEFVADGTIFTKTVDAITIKHIKMIKSDFDCNLKSGPEGRTALEYAFAFRNADVVDALLEANADTNLCDEAGRSPLLIASLMEHVKIVRKLLQHNADTNKQSKYLGSPLMTACSRGNEDVVDALLEANANPNLCDEDGVSPLNIASRGGHHVGIIRKLLQHNADVNHDNIGIWNSSTALMSACKLNLREDVVDVVDALLEANANPNLCDENGDTPLIIASQRGHVGIVRKLLQHNADINQKGRNGRTALSMARGWRMTKVLENFTKN